MNSLAVEVYLKAIYKLQSSQPKVVTSALAEHLGVNPASATGMIKKIGGIKPSQLRAISRC